MIFNKDYLYMGREEHDTPILAFNYSLGGGEVASAYAKGKNYNSATFLTSTGYIYSAQSTASVTYTVNSGTTSFSTSTKNLDYNTQTLDYKGNLSISANSTNSVNNLMYTLVTTSETPSYIIFGAYTHFKYGSNYITAKRYKNGASNYVNISAGTYNIWALSIGENAGELESTTKGGTVINPADCIYKPKLYSATYSETTRENYSLSSQSDTKSGALILIYYPA